MVANGVVTIALSSPPEAEPPDFFTPSDQAPFLASVDGLDRPSSSHPVDCSADDVGPPEFDNLLQSQKKYEESTTRIVPDQSQKPPIHHNHHDITKLSPLEQRSDITPLNSVVVMYEPLHSYQDSCSEETMATHSVFINVRDLPSSDGFNWRKYGQKHIKNSNSARSYYRCTFSNCHAKKKVQICDLSGHPIEIIYKGNHNHDPPDKIRCIKSRRMLSSTLSPVEDGGSFVTEMADDSSFSPMLALVNSMVEYQRSEPQLLLLPPSPEERSEGLDSMIKTATAEIIGECCDQPKSKQRVNERCLEYPIPLVKSAKEPKVVLYATGDVDISSDGYRWRKYGQKKVKGNPHPRSYYRCTSMGCPVRKHVERASGETKATVLTYEGKHNHNTPLPKRRTHTPLLGPCCDRPLRPQPPPEPDSPVSENAADDIPLESARTLLSIRLNH